MSAGFAPGAEAAAQARAAIVLDISRLAARAGMATPTGIDRVELAYAQYLIAAQRPAFFVAAFGWRGLVPLPRGAVERYVAALAELWREGSGGRRRWRARSSALRLRLGSFTRGRRSGLKQLQQAAAQPVYLLVSHHHLEKRRLFRTLQRRYGMPFVCLIHDLIPAQFPEYARPGQGERHRRRVETAAAFADAMIVPSKATGEALQPYLDRAGRAPPVLAASFGVEAANLAPATRIAPSRPYFVCLGTIEARKNHLLLLNLWRDLAAEHGPETPELLLIGRRGWEIENTIDMLDRCPGLRGVVRELSEISDGESGRLIKDARALLLPSFAEGFGFPLAEALALGTPVLASSVAAMRELGAGVPEYLAPHDGAAWRAAIRDYAADPSPRRDAQLRRLAGWRPPRWSDHFAAVESLIADLAREPPAGNLAGR